MSDGRILLGAAELKEAKRIQSLLEERGVHVELASDPQTCGTGSCKPTVNVYIQEADREKVQQFFTEEKAREMAGLEFDPEQVSSVYDSEKETAKCPACGTEFSTKLTECPDCGLVFA